MSNDIPYRPRRRRSMDTLSTLDTPAPPYGLVDPAYRPGSIRSIPGDERPPSPMRSGYRMRVGKLEIRFPDKWTFSTKDVQLLELQAVDRVLSRRLTAIIALFEDAIKRGHTMLYLLLPFLTPARSSEVDMLYYKLRTLWYLCITVGAALCEYGGTVPKDDRKWLSEIMPWIFGHFLQDAIEKAQQLGLSDATGAAPGALPALTAKQRKVVESWARDIDQEDGEEIDTVTQSLSNFNFALQLKRFDEQGSGNSPGSPGLARQT